MAGFDGVLGCALVIPSRRVLSSSDVTVVLIAVSAYDLLNQRPNTVFVPGSSGTRLYISCFVTLDEI